jgi:hypothetical protein
MFWPEYEVSHLFIDECKPVFRKRRLGIKRA